MTMPVHRSQMPVGYLLSLRSQMPAWTLARGQTLLAQSKVIASREPLVFGPEVETIIEPELDRELWGQFVAAWKPRPYEGVAEALALLEAIIELDPDARG